MKLRVQYYYRLILIVIVILCSISPCVRTASAVVATESITIRIYNQLSPFGACLEFCTTQRNHEATFRASIAPATEFAQFERQPVLFSGLLEPAEYARIRSLMLPFRSIPRHLQYEDSDGATIFEGSFVENHFCSGKFYLNPSISQHRAVLKLLLTETTVGRMFDKIVKNDDRDYVLWYKSYLARLGGYKR